MPESWNYNQAVGFLAYGEVGVERYGGPDNAPDGGAAGRRLDEFYLLRSGLPGFETPAARNPDGAADSHGEPPPLVGVALPSAAHSCCDLTVPTIIRGKLAERGDPRTLMPQDVDPRQDQDAQVWMQAKAKLYRAGVAGRVTAYRGVAPYGVCGLIDPVPAGEWNQGLDAVTMCRFRPPEVKVLVEVRQGETTPTPKRGGGAPPRFNWEPALSKLRARLEDYGAPANGDGGQAELERFVASLFLPDHCPGETVIRERVRKEIQAYRHSLNKEGR
jgi:hypothetical protein